MSNFKKGDLVKHKTSNKQMVVIGYSKSNIPLGSLAGKIISAKGYSEDSSLPYIVCSFLEECNKKTIILDPLEIELYN